jgi:outer membrane protein TolC
MTCQRKYLLALNILLIFFFNKPDIQAQTPSVDAALTKAFATDELLPQLIDAAIKYSPEIKRLNSNVKVAQSNLKINKNGIFNGLALQGNYRYGTNFSAVTDESVFNNGAYSLTTVQSGFYSAGIGLNIPLATIFNRKHIIRSSQAQIETIAFERDNSALYVKQEVIRLYQALKLAHKLLALSSSNKQAFQVNYNLAEKEFLQGQLSVSEISRMLEFINKAKMDYETNLNNFQTSLIQLEAYVGVSLMSFLKQVK